MAATVLDKSRFDGKPRAASDTSRLSQHRSLRARRSQVQILALNLVLASFSGVILCGKFSFPQLQTFKLECKEKGSIKNILKNKGEKNSR